MDVREKLVELLGNIYLPMMAGPDTIGEYRIPHKFKKEIADHLISHGVTVQKWISVKDRLPEHGDVVLCHTKHDDLLVFQWCEMSHRWVDQYEDYRQDYITHWMPLPQPPKGE